MKALLSCFILVFIASNTVWAAFYSFPADSIFYPSWNTVNFHSKLSLCGNWKDQTGKIYPVPFSTDESQLIDIQTEFFLDSLPKDTLYIYFGGIAQNAEIYLNGRLLHLTDNPFAEYLLPIPQRLFNRQWNALRVVMTTASSNWLHLIGIHKPVWLLQRRKGTFGQFPKLSQSDTTLFYFPASTTFGLNISDEEFEKDIKEMKEFGVKSLYFPHNISNRLIAKMSLYGIEYSSKPTTYTAFYRTFPGYEHQWNGLVWKFIHKNTPQFGKYQQGTSSGISFQNTQVILVGLLFGLFFIVVWKWFGAKHFRQIFKFWHPTKEIVTIINDKNALLFPYNVYVTIGKYLFQAGFILFLLLIIRQYGWGNEFNIFRDNSFLSIFFQHYAQNEWIMAIAAIVPLTIYNTIKYFLQSFLGRIYEIKEFIMKLTAIEVLADYPMNVFLFMITGSLFFIKTATFFLLTITLLLLSLYMIRRLLIISIGLQSVIKTPTFINLLYICTLELLPWLILF